MINGRITIGVYTVYGVPVVLVRKITTPFHNLYHKSVFHCGEELQVLILDNFKKLYEAYYVVK